MTEFHTQRLLVASPAIGDGNFRRTVVFVLEHSDGGAIGLVLNRPTTLVLGELLPGWEESRSVIFSGGPVSPETIIGLAREWPGAADEGWRRLMGPVGSIKLTRGGPELVDRTAMRVFFGYAGWDEQQLENEIEAGAWFVVDADPDDILCEDPDNLWQAVLARQAGEVSWFSRYPDNPRLN